MASSRSDWLRGKPRSEGSAQVLVAPSASSATEVRGSTLGDSVEKTPLTLVNRLKMRRGEFSFCVVLYRDD